MSVTELPVVLGCFRVAHLDRKQLISSVASAPELHQCLVCSSAALVLVLPQCPTCSSAASVPELPQSPQHSAELKHCSILPATRAETLESNFSRLSSS